MREGAEHAECVDVWMARAVNGLPARQQSEIFVAALTALWRRAGRTLGDVTMSAIVDRVLYSAAELYPVLAALEVEATGVAGADLHAQAGRLDDDALAEPIRFVLVELLTVIDDLTAEILTPALHHELSTMALPDAASGDVNEPAGKPGKKAKR